MQEFIILLMNKYGYLAIFFLIIIENLFPPIPSEVILTMGGFMTTYTSLSVAGVVFFSTLASLFGAIILYYLGKFLNRERLMRITLGKIGRFLCLNAADIDNSISWFQKKGNKTVLYCRFIPILRSLISIPAGMSKMKQGTFLLYTTIGSVIWNMVLVTLGSILGASWHSVAIVMKQYSQITKTALLLICMAAVLYLFNKKQKRKKAGNS